VLERRRKWIDDQQQHLARLSTTYNDLFERAKAKRVWSTVEAANIDIGNLDTLFRSADLRGGFKRAETVKVLRIELPVKGTAYLIAPERPPVEIAAPAAKAEEGVGLPAQLRRWYFLDPAVFDPATINPASFEFRSMVDPPYVPIPPLRIGVVEYFPLSEQFLAFKAKAFEADVVRLTEKLDADLMRDAVIVGGADNYEAQLAAIEEQIREGLREFDARLADNDCDLRAVPDQIAKLADAIAAVAELSACTFARNEQLLPVKTAECIEGQVVPVLRPIEAKLKGVGEKIAKFIEFERKINEIKAKW
jgi:hypothetical protein